MHVWRSPVITLAQLRQGRCGQVLAASTAATGLACFIFRILRPPTWACDAGYGNACLAASVKDLATIRPFIRVFGCLASEHDGAMKIHTNPDQNSKQPDAKGDASCVTCGACCASFRVDFSVQECDDQGGRVPAGLADRLNDSLCRMRGTDYQPARCAALTGKLGQKVACGIYEWRPSPCREFAQGSDACQRTRSRHGLGAL